MTLKRGQIVWVDFTPQKGHEQAGRRPALVISPSAYNNLSNCVLVCPITSNTGAWPWKVMLSDEGDVSGAVLVDQLKSIDAKARHIEDSGQAVATDVMNDVLARLATLVS